MVEAPVASIQSYEVLQKRRDHVRDLLKSILRNMLFKLKQEGWMTDDEKEAKQSVEFLKQFEKGLKLLLKILDKQIVIAGDNRPMSLKRLNKLREETKIAYDKVLVAMDEEVKFEYYSNLERLFNSL